MKKTIFVTALLLSACSPPGPDDVTPLNKSADVAPKESKWMPSSGRFTVSRVQDVRDNAAYTGYRSVYIIVDSETGKEFIGVSGIGISELGSHRSGKSTVMDER
jgi:hypothetical protein